MVESCGKWWNVGYVRNGMKREGKKYQTLVYKRKHNLTDIRMVNREKCYRWIKEG